MPAPKSEQIQHEVIALAKDGHSARAIEAMLKKRKLAVGKSAVADLIRRWRAGAIPDPAVKAPAAVAKAAPSPAASVPRPVPAPPPAPAEDDTDIWGGELDAATAAALGDAAFPDLPPVARPAETPRPALDPGGVLPPLAPPAPRERPPTRPRIPPAPGPAAPPAKPLPPAKDLLEPREELPLDPSDVADFDLQQLVKLAHVFDRKIRKLTRTADVRPIGLLLQARKIIAQEIARLRPPVLPDPAKDPANAFARDELRARLTLAAQAYQRSAAGIAQLRAHVQRAEEEAARAAPPEPVAPSDEGTNG